MSKRYLTIITVLLVLIGCFFLFFDKPTNKELYNKYLNKLVNAKSLDNIENNDDLNVDIEEGYINNQYHYVVTFTSNATLNNFKVMIINNKVSDKEYYPSFGIIDNNNINLVNGNNDEDETKGVNLVVSSREKIEEFRIYVSYNNYEYFYLMNTGE